MSICQIIEFLSNKDNKKGLTHCINPIQLNFQGFSVLIQLNTIVFLSNI